ncbi:hypothetical protein DES44_2051 [Roseateles depolymerans]|uniref:Uncharacterized protein n=1 Tax=Roseateles depolymerans TaxID=76731 RepID=A0A0U3MXC7_9BURK|nr:hypothetical protein RD2015_2105 [Roseateles depolymerans]REG19555.1 hypothetical protein DES44_2051 [Roseateles depolymerans]
MRMALGLLSWPFDASLVADPPLLSRTPLLEGAASRVLFAEVKKGMAGEAGQE